VNKTKYASSDMEQALEAVSQMFAQVKAEPTPAEAMLWAGEIERVGPRAVIAFAHFWLAGGGQNGFLRAPRIMDLRRFCDPTWSDEVGALTRLQNLVSRFGPYCVPTERDGMDAKLAETVRLLGGWVRVCELLPDPSDDFAFRAFEKRFVSAWQQAEVRVVRGDVSAAPLLPIGSTGSQPRLAAPVETVHNDEEENSRLTAQRG